MTTISGNSPAVYVSTPQALPMDIPLPGNRRPLDPSIAAPLQRATSLGANPLPSPGEIRLEPGVQFRLQDMSASHRADARLVLAEFERQERDRELTLRVSQASVDKQLYETKYQALDQSREAAGHKRDAGLTEGITQIAGGAFEAGSGGMALHKGVKANKAAREKLKNEDTGTTESKALADDRAKAAQLKDEISDLQDNQPQNEGRTDSNFEAESVAHERTISAKRDELTLVNKSIGERTQRIERAGANAAKADVTEKGLRTWETALPAIGRGVGAVISGVGNTVAAQEKYEGELDENDAQRLNTGAEILQSLSKRLDDSANTAGAGARKSDDLYQEMVQLENTTNSKILA